MLLTGANNETYRTLMQMRPNEFGWLTQPRAYYRNKLSTDERVRWAMDNDAYNGFHSERFMAALEHMKDYAERCLFIVCPDVVGDHKATLKLWHEWKFVLRSFDYPIAFVAQDGSAPGVIPWNEIDALFVGGTDQFKDRESLPVIRTAQRLKKWVHVGRVNDSRYRLRFCLEVGVDSIDGTAYALKPDKMLTWYQNELNMWQLQKRLL